MMETKLRATPAVREAAILDLEKKLNSLLPPVLRSCYATSNGGNFSDPRDRECN